MHHHDHASHPTTTGMTMPGLAPFYDILTTVVSLGRERRFRRAILDVAALQPGERVLDVGCGTGTLALLAKKQLGPDSAVSGIDATPQMIDRARRKARRRGLDVAFEVGVVEALDFPDASFDAVLSTLMMHHLPADLQPRALAEITRVLKPGGRVVIVDFSQMEPGLMTAVHGSDPEGEDRKDVLVRLVEDGGYRDLKIGSMPLRGVFSVVGHKPG